jgi:3-phosphoglycerate kinase
MITLYFYAWVNFLLYYFYMKSITQAKIKKGTYVLLRADLNVPLVDGKVRDDFRISKIIPTLEYLQKKGARTIVISHLGEKGETLAPVAKHLSKKIKSVTFVPHIFGEEVLAAREKMTAGDIIILENLRTDEGEKSNNTLFAKTLAGLGEVFVSDAFSASHRKHASIVGVPKYLPSYAGLQLAEEIKHLSKILQPKHPFVFILGGAKISTKLPLLKNYKEKADTLFVGGAVANDFFKARGWEVGTSLVDDTLVPKNILSAKNVLIPLDVITDSHEVKLSEKVGKKDRILDAGPATVAQMSEKIKQAKLVLLNGPLGDYEHGFAAGTESLLKAMVASKAITIVGGGDSVATVQKLKLEKKLTFVSTGGGAMLEYLAQGTLPGIKALK